MPAKQRVNFSFSLILALLVAVCTVFPTLSTAQRSGTAQPPSPKALKPNATSRSLTKFKTASKLEPGDLYVAIDDAARLMGVDSFGGKWVRPQKDSVSYAAMHIEFDSEESCEQFAMKTSVISRIDRFADVFVSMDQGAVREWEKIAAEPGVVEIQLSGVYAIPNTPTPQTTEETLLQDDVEEKSEEIVRGGLDGLTGKGVIIAIIDTGLDFRNDDFKVYVNGTPKSRLLYYWDTTDKNTSAVRLDSKPPLSYPNGSPVGTLYDQKQLNDELNAKRHVIPSGDYVGHGTACASIAAGNGRNDPAQRALTKGVAPEADLIAVRIGGIKGTNGQISPELRNGYLLDAIVNWLDTVAGDRPLVISCSWGSQVGDPGMSRIVEHRLNTRFPLSSRGRAIVFAAGNSALRPWHANVNEDQMTQPVTWEADEGRSAYIEVHLDNDALDDITLTPVEGSSFQEVAVRTNPFTKRGVAYIKAPEGKGGLFLTSPSGRGIKADIYINYGHFTGAYTTQDGMMGSPGAADNAISVGSYDFNDWFNRKKRTSCGRAITLGSLSCYSSGGIVRANYVKPDVIAPGQIFYASQARKFTGRGRDEMDARNEQWVVEDKQRWDGTEKYILFDGTSAATPYVAGIIALMMQKQLIVNKDQPDNRLMKLRDIKLLMQQYATKDPMPSGFPNSMWGNGKLDVPAVKRILSAIK